MSRLLLSIILLASASWNASAGMSRVDNTTFATSYVMQVCPVLMGSRPAAVYIKEMSARGRITSPEAWAFTRSCDAVGGAKARTL